MSTIPEEVGPVFDAGIVSATYGSLGLFIKPGTYQKQLQSQLRDDVIGALSIAIGDRDLAFWKRQSQSDWSEGEGQDYFANAARYDTASSLDVSTPHQLRLVPQAALIRSAGGAALNGRGAVYCKNNAFFPWTDGNYTYVTSGLVSNIVGAGGVNRIISDIVTDGTTVFFALETNAGVWSTAGAVPIPLVQYDAPGSFYSRLVYDQLKKILYASTSVLVGAACRLDKINAGGVSTTIYDFVTGRIDALEMYQGNVIVGWNDASGNIGSSGFMGRSRVFKYDGTNVTSFADLPEGTMIVGLKSALGVLYVMCVENDPLDPQNSPPAQIFTLYSVIGGTITKLGATTSGQAVASTNNYYIGALSMGITGGRHVFFPLAGNTLRYDTETGGLSKSLGDDGVPAISGFAIAVMTGLMLMSGRGVLCVLAGGKTTGGIFNLNGTINGMVPSDPTAGTARLTSSRMDAGLPYVNKFWFSLDVNLAKALATGESVEMEYSTDDGNNWTTCGNSPFSTAGDRAVSFSVSATSHHLRYRIRPVANAGGSVGPIISAVSARYTVVNTNGSVYRMKVQCADNTRGRGNRIEEGYAKDALAFLDNIARANETVTFYEPGDSDRTARTCWVMAMDRAMPNTGGSYDPLKAEGDVDLVLWEAVA